MKLQKYRWSTAYESAEEELVRLLHSKHIEAERINVEADSLLQLSTENSAIKLWCAEGSFVVMTDSKRFSMQPGDTLDLPRQTTSSTSVGMTGCVVYVSSIAS